MIKIKNLLLYILLSVGIYSISGRCCCKNKNKTPNDSRKIDKTINEESEEEKSVELEELKKEEDNKEGGEGEELKKEEDNKEGGEGEEPKKEEDNKEGGEGEEPKKEDKLEEDKNKEKKDKEKKEEEPEKEDKLEKEKEREEKEKERLERKENAKAAKDKVDKYVIKEEEKGKYIFTITNILQLSSYIFEGTNSCIVEIKIKNTSNTKWSVNMNLTYYSKDLTNYGEMRIKDQNAEQEQVYKLQVNNLSEYKTGEYQYYFYISDNDKIYLMDNKDKEIGFEIKIKGKNEANEEIKKYADEIKVFRDNFGINEEDYDDEKILDALKEGKFDHDKAFKKIFNT